MLIDNPQKIKEELLKIIYMPKNVEILYYDASLKELLDTNVDEIYKSTLALYKQTQEKLNNINQILSSYEKRFELSPISKQNMTEQDYIRIIQKLEIEYSQKFDESKTLDSKINSIKNAMAIQKEKIEMQKVEDEKEYSTRNEKLEQKNKELKQQNLLLQAEIDLLETKIKAEQYLIDTYRTRAKLIGANQDLTGRKTIRCGFCGTKFKLGENDCLTKIQEESQKIFQKIEEKTAQIEKFSQKIEETQEKLNMNCEEILRNDDLKIVHELYIKKSEKLLKLESKLFEIEDQLQDCFIYQKSLNKKYGKSLVNLKDKLNKAKEQFDDYINFAKERESLKSELKMREDLKAELNEYENQLNFYIKFLKIKYKLIERRMSELFDNNITFSFYKIEGFYVRDESKIFYRGVAPQYLSLNDQEEMEELLVNKISHLK